MTATHETPLFRPAIRVRNIEGTRILQREHAVSKSQLAINTANQFIIAIAAMMMPPQMVPNRHCESRKYPVRCNRWPTSN